MTRDLEQALLDEIHAAPDDDAPRSIYADYLIQHGDPRGTFIALQLARARDRDPVPSAEEQQLLDTHWQTWAPPRLTGTDVVFERGFWSGLWHDGALADETLADPAWATLRHLAIQRAPRLAAILAATGRALRTIRVPSHAAFLQVAHPELRLEEITLGFDLTRDPPALAPARAVPGLRRLGFDSFGEFGVRWVERADAIGIREVVLHLGANPAYVRDILKGAKRTRVAKLALALSDAITLHATRDSDGTLAVRAIELPSTFPTFGRVTWWIAELGALVDRDLKVTMQAITATLALSAEARGLRLVQRAQRFEARPR